MGSRYQLEHGVGACSEGFILSLGSVRSFYGSRDLRFAVEFTYHNPGPAEVIHCYVICSRQILGFLVETFSEEDYGGSRPIYSLSIEEKKARNFNVTGA
jgi:hypothetical protein